MWDINLLLPFVVNVIASKHGKIIRMMIFKLQIKLLVQLLDEKTALCKTKSSFPFLGYTECVDFYGT